MSATAADDQTASTRLIRAKPLPGVPRFGLAFLLRPVPRGVAPVVAALSAVPGIVSLVKLGGVPTTPAGWLPYALPLGIGVAVLLGPRHQRAAMVALALGTALGLDPASAVIEAGPRSLAGVLEVLIWGGVSWVVYLVGARCRPWWSVPLVAGWVALLMVLPGSADGILLAVAVGWWVVGLMVRSQQRLADRLIKRAAELAAEQERFAAEAVRLERAVIARELHDVVAHCMTVIVIQAQAARQLLDRDAEAATTALDAILASAREAENDIGALAALINPDTAQALTRELLDELVVRAAAAGSTVKLALVGDPLALEPELAGATHRAIQEALTNVFRHAPGAPIDIALTIEPFSLVVVNGEPAVDVTLARIGTGRGLIGLQERMRSLGRSTAYGSVNDGGWQLRVS